MAKTEPRRQQIINLLEETGTLNVSELADRFGPRWRPVGLACLLVGTLAQPLVLDVLHDRTIARADTRVVANEWIQANLPAGSRLKIEDYSLRDLSTQARTYTPNTADLKIERFEGSPEAEQARAFADRNVQFVVTSSFNFERYLLDPSQPSQQDSAQRYQRILALSPRQ